MKTKFYTLKLLLPIGLFFLFSFHAVNAQKKIAYLTDPGSTVYETSTIDFLKEQGYNVVELTQVDITDLTGGDASALFDEMNSSDLVIISRGTQSTPFSTTSKENWASLNVPVMINSPYAARNSRLCLFNTPNIVTNTDVETIIQFEKPDDVITTDVFLDESNRVSYYTATINFIGVTASQLGTDSNFELIATCDVVDGTDFSNIGIARLAAGTESYAGSGFTPSSNWTYMPKGASEQATVVDNFQLTDDGKLIYLNEIKNLLGELVTDGINSFSDGSKQLTAYPNPCSDKLNIDFTSKIIGKVKISLISLTGQEEMVYTTEIYNSGKQTIQLNTRNLNDGIYFTKMQIGNHVEIQKVVLTK